MLVPIIKIVMLAALNRVSQAFNDSYILLKTSGV